MSTEGSVEQAVRQALGSGCILLTPGKGYPPRNQKSFAVTAVSNTSVRVDRLTSEIRFDVLEYAVSGIRDAGGEVPIGGKQDWADNGTLERFLQDARGNNTRTSTYVAPILVASGIAEYVPAPRAKRIRLLPPYTPVQPPHAAANYPRPPAPTAKPAQASQSMPAAKPTRIPAKPRIGAGPVEQAVRQALGSGCILLTPGRGYPPRNQESFEVIDVSDTGVKVNKLGQEIHFEVLEYAVTGIRDAGGAVPIGGKQGWADSGTLERFLQDARGNNTRTSTYVAPILVACGIAEYVPAPGAKWIVLTSPFAEQSVLSATAPYGEPAGPAIADQIADLRRLPDGWRNGEGVAFNPSYLEWMADACRRLYPPHAPVPMVCPTTYGIVSLEWTLPAAEVSLEIDPETHQGELVWANARNASSGEIVIDMAGADGWGSLADCLARFNGAAL